MGTWIGVALVAVIGCIPIIGQPVQVDEGILIDPTAGAKASLSSSGTLTYLKGRAEFTPGRSFQLRVVDGEVPARVEP